MFKNGVVYFVVMALTGLLLGTSFVLSLGNHYGTERPTYVDFNKVASDSVLGKELTSNIKAISEKYQKQFDFESAKLSTQADKENLARTKQKDFEDEKNKLLGAYNDKINPALLDFGQANHYTAIHAMGPYVLLVDKKFDKTDEFVKFLNLRK